MLQEGIYLFLKICLQIFPISHHNCLKNEVTYSYGFLSFIFTCLSADEEKWEKKQIQNTQHY